MQIPKIFPLLFERVNVDLSFDYNTNSKIDIGDVQQMTKYATNDFYDAMTISATLSNSSIPSIPVSNFTINNMKIMYPYSNFSIMHLQNLKTLIYNVTGIDFSIFTDNSTLYAELQRNWLIVINTNYKYGIYNFSDTVGVNSFPFNLNLNN